ncbi:MAG: hypothetical protein Q8878_04755 [Bacillota bacterium]|nr:hypothetical protein [Bacillota bacterium]
MLIKKGEVRKIGIEVTSRSNQDFVIESADYEITGPDSGEPERGIPTIDGHKIAALFSATKAGTSCCEFTFRIGPEIIKSKINIEVV